MRTTALCALFALLLAACAAKEGAAPPPAEPPGTQLANPASVNCEQKGGKLEIVEGEGGQQGICVLPDGTRCDEWAYFRGECP